jgi:hypothetical protein
MWASVQCLYYDQCHNFLETVKPNHTSEVGVCCTLFSLTLPIVSKGVIDESPIWPSWDPHGKFGEFSQRKFGSNRCWTDAGQTDAGQNPRLHTHYHVMRCCATKNISYHKHYTIQAFLSIIQNIPLRVWINIRIFYIDITKLSSRWQLQSKLSRFAILSIINPMTNHPSTHSLPTQS